MINVGSQANTQRIEGLNTVTADLSVSDVMERWPATIAVFQAYRMACVGCFMAPFDTLAEAAHNYRLDVDQLVRALQERIEATAVKGDGTSTRGTSIT
jgi:hybrid cluster-associated redox disulfide protein